MLALVGSGEYLPEMDNVDRQLLGLFDGPAKVVCLPTAAGTEGETMIDDWARRGVEHFARLGADAESVRVWNQATANEPAFADRIAEADFIYLSGGKPAYLYDTLKDSLAWEAILNVVSNGGLLAGCSAGAMIQGEIFAGFPRSRQHEGFGLWPNINVIPHFDELPSALIASIRMLVGKKTTIVGVEGNTALLQTDSGYEVIGQGVTIWTPERKTRHMAGPLTDETFG